MNAYQQNQNNHQHEYGQHCPIYGVDRGLAIQVANRVNQSERPVVHSIQAGCEPIEYEL